MPRKQNGFGNATTRAFKASHNRNKGKGVVSAGAYTSEQRYGQRGT